MKNLFALLTGINHYHPGSDVSSLKGCENDILQLEGFLTDHFKKEQLQIEKLINSQATYAGVIAHFEEHLMQAGPDDVVLFAYCGHGSREPALPIFDQYFSEDKQETLVLYDSRLPNGNDLADKELAFLLEAVAAKGAHVVVIMDSCHSGSVTRDMADITLGKPRQTSDKKIPRSLDSFLQGFRKKEFENGYLNKRFPNGKGLYLPSSRHILLSACKRTEKAYELDNDHGLFSHYLGKALEETHGQLSYAELFSKCRWSVAKKTDKQHPQFQPSGFFNGHDSFLGLGKKGTGKTAQIFFEDNKWRVEMGAVDRLPVISDQPAYFEVIEDGLKIGQARTSFVGLEKSTVQLEGFTGNFSKRYDTELLSIPEPPPTYRLEGTKNTLVEALDALKKFKPVHFSLEKDPPNAAYRVALEKNDILLYRESDQLLIRRLEGNDRPAMFHDAFEKLELIALWESSVALHNGNTRIKKNDVEILFVELDDNNNVLYKHSGSEVILDLLKDESRRVRIEVRNNNPTKARHCALFYASSYYGFLNTSFNELVYPLKTVIAWERTPHGEPLVFDLAGKNEAMDIFKLFVSNSPIDLSGMGQEGFLVGETKSHWKKKGQDDSQVRGDRSALGGFGLRSTVKEEDDDWTVVTTKVKSVAKKPAISDRPVPLAGGAISFQPHPSFRADVSFGATSTGGRNIEPMSIIAEMAQACDATLFKIGDASRSVAPANMIELSNIENANDLADRPLEFNLVAGLKEGETLLPLTFDGEHILPVGTVERTKDGDAKVSIRHIPDTADERRRSVGKALKLSFLRLVLGKKDVDYLRWVSYDEDEIDRIDEGVAKKVDGANKILLLIHGIIGDTKPMCKCVRPLLNEPYDLILTFDYENLSTGIDEIAKSLKAKLAGAGIKEGSGKELTIMAHSMGGLVARSFIERMQGNKFVKHLIMAGTPNKGSNIAKITKYRDMGLMLMGLASNLPWSFPGMSLLLAVVEGSKAVTKTLEQMDFVNNPFLANLAEAPDPVIPYSVVAGNIEVYLQEYEDDRKLVDKLYALGGSTFYGDEPNDVAVSQESIKWIPTGRAKIPNVFDVPCHHLNYFEEEKSVNVLLGLLNPA